MQSLHGLFDGRVSVESMALEHIDIVELESVERVNDRRKDSLASAAASAYLGPLATHLAAETLQVDSTGRWPHRILLIAIVRLERLGQYDDAFTGNLVFLQKPA